MDEVGDSLLCQCNNFRLCYITGATLTTAQRNRAENRQWAYNQMQMWFRISSDQFIEIVNNSHSPDATVQAIKNAAKRDGALCRCKKITNVFIAHCHGAVCLKKALHALSNTCDGFKQYTNQMALFTIGGLTILPSDMAKVSENYYFLNDVFFLSYNSWKKSKTNWNITPLGPMKRFNDDSFENVDCKCCSSEYHQPRLAITAKPFVTSEASLVGKCDRTLTSKCFHRRKLIANTSEEEQSNEKCVEAVSRVFNKTLISTGTEILKVAWENNCKIQGHYAHDCMNCRNLQKKIKLKLKISP